MANPDVVQNILSLHPEWIEGNGKADAKHVQRFGGTEPEAASRIWAKVLSEPYPLVVDRVFKSFGDGSHFVSENTAQALGLIADDAPPPPTRPRALTTEDAIELAGQGWHIDGSGTFLDLSKPENVIVMERRKAFARNVPPSWAGIDPVFYWFFCIRGDIESGVPDLGTRPYAPSAGIRGVSFQSWLDRMNGKAGFAPKSDKVLG